jgi:RHS repeat-associated protein
MGLVGCIARQLAEEYVEDFVVDKAIGAISALVGPLLGAEQFPQPSPPQPAVTVGHQIKHASFLAALAGAALGAALTVGAVTLIGLTGGALLVGGVVIGMAIGAAVNKGVSWVDSMLPADDGPVLPPCSPNVFIDGLPAARAGLDLVACTRHSVPPLIAEGSSTVYINGLPLARFDDKTACGAPLQQGVTTVLVGGEKMPMVEISGEFLWWQSALIFATGALIPPSKCMVQGLRNLPKALMNNGRALTRVLSSSARSAANLSRSVGNAISKGAKNIFKGAMAGLSKGAQFAKQAANALKAQLGKLRGALKGLWAGSCKASKGSSTPTRKNSGDSDGTPLKDPKCENGCPVDASTGAVVETRVDFEFGRTLPIHFVRSYDGLREHQGLLGRRWMDTFGEHLRLSFDGERVEFACVSGELIPFDITSTDVRVFNPRFPTYTLVREPGGFAVHDLRDDRTRHFMIEGSRGRLTRIADARGNHVELRYSGHELVALQHSDGPCIELHRALDDEAEREVLTFVRTDLPAPKILATYTSERGCLVEAESRSAAHLSYRYDHEGRMRRWSDAHKTWATYDYDDRGRCVRSRAADNLHSIDLRYDDATGCTRVVDGRGHEQRFYFDERRRLLRLEDPLGSAESFEYDRHGKRVAHTDAAGHTERYAYDAVSGLLFRQIDREEHVTEFFYDDDLRLIGVLDTEEQLWSYERDARGSVTAILAPNGSTYRYTYNPRGQLATVEHPSGRSRQLTYDKHHRLVSETDWRGNRHRYRYDGQDRLTERRDEHERARAVFYDPRDRVSSYRHPDGHRLVYEYDVEHHLVGLTDENGHTSRAEFGAFDLQTSSLDAEGRRYSFAYDPVHLLLTEVNAPDGRRYRLGRDAAGRVVEAKDYHGSKSRYTHDACGRVILKVNATGQRTRYTYDRRDDLSSIEADGETTTLERDRLGRVVRASNNVTTLEWEYDALGQVTRSTQDGEAIDYTYDASGNCIERALAPSPWEQVSHTTRCSHDADGQLTRIELAEGALEIERDDRGLATAIRSDQGISLKQAHDLRGRLTEQRLHAHGDGARASTPDSVARSYSYDPANNPLELRDAHWGTTRYTYDRSDRILETQRGARQSEVFDYTSNGLLAAAGAPGRPDRFHLTERGRLHRHGDTRYTYDDAGRLIARTVHRKGFRSRSWTFSWNSLDQLVEVRTPEWQTWRYAYDPLGRRIRKFNPETRESVLFLWDGDVLLREINLGPVRAAHDQASVEITYWHHEPGTFRPIARQRDGAMSLVVVDAIGTPTELVSLEGHVTWRAQHRTWGQRGRADPEEAAQACPIRFQGQYEDIETGFHYNRFRYYDPSAALYLSPDPLGLAGGLQPHAYVPTPNCWVDPLGLTECGKWSRAPKSIQDQMTLNASKQGAGRIIIQNLNDPAFKGMEKWEYKVKSTNGQDSVVHYVRDPSNGELMDFKFKKHSTHQPKPWGNDPVIDAYTD